MSFFSKCFSALVLALALGVVGPAQASERINLNSADAATLDRVMDGVGPAKAAAIVEHRRVHGPFRTVDQLLDVKGIGPATLELNRARIMVAGTTAPARPQAAAAPRPASTTPRLSAPAPRVR